MNENLLGNQVLRKELLQPLQSHLMQYTKKSYVFIRVQKRAGSSGSLPLSNPRTDSYITRRQHTYVCYL